MDEATRQDLIAAILAYGAQRALAGPGTYEGSVKAAFNDVLVKIDALPTLDRDPRRWGRALDVMGEPAPTETQRRARHRRLVAAVGELAEIARAHLPSYSEIAPAEAPEGRR